MSLKDREDEGLDEVKVAISLIVRVPFLIMFLFFFLTFVKVVLLGSSFLAPFHSFIRHICCKAESQSHSMGSGCEFAPVVTCAHHGCFAWLKTRIKLLLYLTQRDVVMLGTSLEMKTVMGQTLFFILVCFWLGRGVLV